MEAVRMGPHPSLVWVLADREGHIGLQASVLAAATRGGNSGIVPVPAWDAENHWQGRVRGRSLAPRVRSAIGFCGERE